MTESQEKSYTGKFFDFEIFDLKYVLKHSDLITSDQKKIRPKTFDIDIFHYFCYFCRKTTESKEKNCTEKIFDFKFLQFLVKNVFIKTDFFYYFDVIESTIS